MDEFVTYLSPSRTYRQAIPDSDCPERLSLQTENRSLWPRRRANCRVFSVCSVTGLKFWQRLVRYGVFARPALSCTSVSGCLVTLSCRSMRKRLRLRWLREAYGELLLRCGAPPITVEGICNGLRRTAIIGLELGEGSSAPRTRMIGNGALWRAPGALARHAASRSWLLRSPARFDEIGVGPPCRGLHLLGHGLPAHLENSGAVKTRLPWYKSYAGISGRASRHQTRDPTPDRTNVFFVCSQQRPQHPSHPLSLVRTLCASSGVRLRKRTPRRPRFLR